ncbi:hypothetical protein BCR35DRAFT_328824 [Leucosporidium creatinivorum]|uniref:Chromatin modification-related protein n=1 Tax=Leucosporidium creatinivorum TaxID=106004 RepID=A0A1Y2G1Y3_9BASI|nr:hypothetical protein BCR35DRAFT_328824 [Leucosporidium creatinivorum]
MATTEDAAVLLAEVVGSLDNLPSEVHHILQEIGHKEGKTNDIKNRAIARDQSIQRHARPVAQGGQGLLVPNSKEPSLITKIRSDLDRAEVSAKEKVALSERGVNLLSRHLNRLQTQLELLTPNVPPLPTLPSFTPPAQTQPTPSQYAAAGAAAQGYNPAAPVPQYHNPYAPSAYAAAGAGGYGYGTPIDKRKIAPPQSSPPIAGYPYSPSASGSGTPLAPTPGGSSNRVARPSRLQTVTTYPNSAPGTSSHSGGHPTGGGGGGGGTPAQAAQLQQQQLAQHQHLQQQQMRLAAQAQALAAQQMANQQQMQAMQSGHAHHGGAGSGGGGGGHGGQKRKRHDEEESADTGEEGGEGEDMTPYCFCHRPSFGEMIGCDAPNCAIEWFHLACVGLKTVPNDSWYCKDCEGKQKSSGGRKRR